MKRFSIYTVDMPFKSFLFLANKKHSTENKYILLQIERFQYRRNYKNSWSENKESTKLPSTVKKERIKAEIQKPMHASCSKVQPNTL